MESECVGSWIEAFKSHSVNWYGKSNAINLVSGFVKRNRYILMNLHLHLHYLTKQKNQITKNMQNNVVDIYATLKKFNNIRCCNSQQAACMGSVSDR